MKHTAQPALFQDGSDLPLFTQATQADMIHSYSVFGTATKNDKNGTFYWNEDAASESEAVAATVKTFTDAGYTEIKIERTEISQFNPSPFILFLRRIK